MQGDNLDSLIVSMGETEIHRRLQALEEAQEAYLSARRELRESEELHRLTLSSISDAVFITDDDGQFTFICPNADVIFGYKEVEIADLRNICALLGPDALDVGDLAAQGEIANLDFEVRDRHGREHSLLVNVKRVDIRGGTRLYSCRDVTAERKAEQAIMQAIENEQRRLSQDLHDGLTQHLLGVLSMSKLLERHLDAEENPRSREAREVTELLAQAVAQTRQLSRGLYPAGIESDTLEALLAQLAQRVDSIHKLDCAFSAPESDAYAHHDPLDVEMKTHLYRIAQEAVSNALRHSHASRLEITLHRTPDELMLSIRDDGHGLKGVSADGVTGLGFRSMRHRARMIGAALRVENRPEGGVEVTCRLKIREAGATPRSEEDHKHE